jgi:hypothetical protein
MKLVEHVAHIRKQLRHDIFLVRKPVGKKSLGIPTCRVKDNIKMDIMLICCHVI